MIPSEESRASASAGRGRGGGGGAPGWGKGGAVENVLARSGSCEASIRTELDIGSNGVKGTVDFDMSPGLS